MSAPSCGSCRYFDRGAGRVDGQDVAIGECRRHAPAATPGRAAWPEVPVGAWCGEHGPIPAPWGSEPEFAGAMCSCPIYRRDGGLNLNASGPPTEPNPSCPTHGTRVTG